MKTNKKMLGIFAVFAIALLGVGMVVAYQGNPDVQGPNYSEDRHIAMEEAFDNLNYDAWYELMSENQHRGKIMDVITEENFETFIESRNAMREGNFELAKELNAELGIGQGKRLGGEGHLEGMKGQGPRNGNGMGGPRMGQGMKDSGNFGNCPYAN